MQAAKLPIIIDVALWHKNLEAHALKPSGQHIPPPHSGIYDIKGSFFVLLAVCNEFSWVILIWGHCGINSCEHNRYWLCTPQYIVEIGWMVIPWYQFFCFIRGDYRVLLVQHFSGPQKRKYLNYRGLILPFDIFCILPTVIKYCQFQ